jgi:hypothetical protein
METYNLSFRFFKSLSSADGAQSLRRENKNFFEKTLFKTADRKY